MTLPPEQRRAANAMSEDRLMELIRAACKELGLAVFHVHDARRSWGPGFPDLVICGSDVLYAECKDADGELSAFQRQWMRRLIAAGQQWRLWRPEHWLTGEIAAELAMMAIEREKHESPGSTQVARG